MGNLLKIDTPLGRGEQRPGDGNGDLDMPSPPSPGLAVSLVIPSRSLHPPLVYLTQPPTDYLIYRNRC